MGSLLGAPGVLSNELIIVSVEAVGCLLALYAILKSAGRKPLLPERPKFKSAVRETTESRASAAKVDESADLDQARDFVKMKALTLHRLDCPVLDISRNLRIPLEEVELIVRLARLRSTNQALC